MDPVMTKIDPNLLRTMPAAYERMREAIANLPENDLIPINIDVMAAVTTARGAVHKTAALMPSIREMLPNHDLSAFEKLEDVALACGFAASQYTLAITSTEVLPEIAAKAIHVRDVLVTDAEGLTKRGLIDRSALKGVMGTTAYRAIAHDLNLVSSLLRGLKGTLGDRITSITAELDEADVLSAMLTDQVSIRESAPTIVADASKTRHRAVTLLIRTYDEVRRVMTFVRWHDEDVDDIAPSLYAGRIGKKQKTQATDIPSKTAEKETVINGALEAASEPEPAFVGMPGGSPLR